MAPQLKAFGHTHIGMRRAQNQDSFLVLAELGLFVVADGMGGHKGGETASSMAVSTIGDYFRSFSAAPRSQSAITKIQNAITAANQAIQAKGVQEIELQGMGTTTTTLYFEDEKLYIGHVGDSRSYLVQKGAIWQLTRDHSLVQEKLRAGMITRDQLKTDRMKNVITRSVGFEPQVDVDIYEFSPKSGDIFVICSDGLSGMIDDSEILSIIEQNIGNQQSVEGAAKELIEAANRNGGEDNVTAVVIEYT